MDGPLGGVVVSLGEMPASCRSGQQGAQRGEWGYARVGPRRGMATSMLLLLPVTQTRFVLQALNP